MSGLLLDRPRSLRLPPPTEERRRLRRLAEARRSPFSRAIVALGRADQALLITLRTRGHSEPVERGMQALGVFGEYGIGWASLSLVGAAVSPQRRGGYLRAAVVAPVAVGVNGAVKALVGRRRPIIDGHPPLGPAPTQLSFPSGHTTSAVAAATALSRVDRRLLVPIFALAKLIGIGRPYLGMHYPSDVLAGAALGWLIGRVWPMGSPEPAASPSSTGSLETPFRDPAAEPDEEGRR